MSICVWRIQMYKFEIFLWNLINLNTCFDLFYLLLRFYNITKFPQYHHDIKISNVCAYWSSCNIILELEFMKYREINLVLSPVCSHTEPVNHFCNKHTFSLKIHQHESFFSFVLLINPLIFPNWNGWPNGLEPIASIENSPWHKMYLIIWPYNIEKVMNVWTMNKS